MRLAVLLCSLVLAVPAFAQPKQRVEKAADLPRFAYKFEAKVKDVVRDEAKFRPFAGELRAPRRGGVARRSGGDALPACSPSWS